MESLCSHVGLALRRNARKVGCVVLAFWGGFCQCVQIYVGALNQSWAIGIGLVKVSGMEVLGSAEGREVMAWVKYTPMVMCLAMDEDLF